MKSSKKSYCQNSLNRFRIFNQDASLKQQYPYSLKPKQSEKLPKKVKKLYFVNPNILFMHQQSHQMYKDNLRIRSAMGLNKLKNRPPHSFQKQSSFPEQSVRAQTCQSYNRNENKNFERNTTKDSKFTKLYDKHKIDKQNGKSQLSHTKKLSQYIKVEEMFSVFRKTGYLKKRNNK